MACDRQGTSLKVGDNVEVFDNSYALKLCRIAPGRRQCWNNEVDINLKAKNLTIVEVDLKVPAMHDFEPRIKTNDEDGPVFLNIMLKDEFDHLWLTRSGLCEKIIPVRYFNLHWGDGSVETISGETLGKALVKSGNCHAQLLQRLDHCDETKVN